MEVVDLDQVVFNDDGLVPCIVQEWRTGEVLTLAWMNRESLELTLGSGETHFFSRSRQELWHKGETSGNVQRVRSLRYDCDGDALLALVEAAGPACHTGERTCFHRALDEDGEVELFEALPLLARTLRLRREQMPAGSYTTELFSDGLDRIAAKVAEESAEVIQAARSESDERVGEEAADLIYHLGVLLELRELCFEDALNVLTKRMK